jgi:hypothetical protein
MKVILSRKGFDSSYGGHASPILPDGTLLSLPIPSRYDKIKFAELSYDDYSYYQIIKQLNPHSKIKESYSCHLDPDIRKDVFTRDTDWVPLFGQSDTALSHLQNMNVQVGDLFLFFGWFKETEKIGKKLQYRSGAKDLHIIYGYLQIGKIYDDSKFPDHINYHPHTNSRFQRKRNCIYQASERLSFAPDYPGAGCFTFHEALVLTKQGAYSRSQWELPPFFSKNKIAISYHPGNPYKDGYFQAAAKGQEFVIEENAEVTSWAESLIKNYAEHR